MDICLASIEKVHKQPNRCQNVSHAARPATAMPAKDNAQLPFGRNAERQPEAGASGGEGDRVPDFDDGVGGAEKATAAKTSRYFRQRGQSGQRCYLSRS